MMIKILRYTLILSLLFSAMMVAVSAQECPKNPGPELNLPQQNLTFANNTQITVEYAKSDQEKARGLMYRTSMPEEHGMLFAWDKNARRFFWMHNTCIPLDMLFVDSNKEIVGILRNVPIMSDKIYTVEKPAQYVIEVNAGFAARHEIEEGMRVAF